MEEKKYHERIDKKYTLYIKDVQKFKSLRDEVRMLYYHRYGNSLSMGDTLLVMLSLAKSVLEHEGYEVKGNDNFNKLEDRYGRIE